MALYVVAALVIGARAYWLLYRMIVPKIIHDTTGKMREWADASKAFTGILASYVKRGDEIGAALKKLERMGFRPVAASEEGPLINRYTLPAVFAPILPLTTWTVETKSDDGVQVSAVRGVASRKGD
jgi:hypothetical protein